LVTRIVGVTADRWRGILSGPIDGFERQRRTWPAVEATTGLVVEHRASGFTGRVVRVRGDAVVVRGATGLERELRMLAGAFGVDGRDVTLVAPRAAPPRRGAAIAVSAAARTASGSTAVPGAPAQVARASRIWVEGVHDAELVEKVWGDDLRVEGVVVERLDGIDVLDREIERFRPGPTNRLGVLVDHLVDGSKEARIAADVRRRHHDHVLVTGTPVVDVWEAVNPRVAGLPGGEWPVVPRGRPWKEGVLAAIGFTGTPGEFWRQLLARVESYADLAPALVGSVERLIDFVTEPPPNGPNAR
jgi:hypothetical protein